MDKKKLVIIGSGPAGYTAGIYASRANLEPVLFEGINSGTPGGQLMTTTDVENYPGFPDGVQGPEMMQMFKKQAAKFGTTILTEDVERVDFSKKPFEVFGSKNQFQADTVIIATGAYAKRLDIEGTRDGELWQKGVSACAVCDGAMPMFRDKPLFVIGGGDSAMEEALFLTKFGSKVYIVHRRDQLRASKIMAKRAQENPKIEILYNKVVVKASGSNVLESVVIEDTGSKQQETKEAAGLFFAIGHQPATAFLNGQLELNEQGYIKVQPGSTKTNVEGVFAAGDVFDYVYRQAITAAGTGCMAALDAEHYLAGLGAGV